MIVKNYIFILMIIFVFVSFGLTFSLGYLVGNDNSKLLTKEDFIGNNVKILGLWQKQADGKKIISVITNNRTISELIETLRHELCHEIYYRNTLKYNSFESELFAEKCDPSDYKGQIRFIINGNKLI